MIASAWVCLLLPLASAIAITLGGTRISRRVAAYISTLTTMAAFVQSGSVAGVFHVESTEIAVLHIVGAVSYVVAARPTVRRILGAEHDKRAYAREAVIFARRVVGMDSEVSHGSRDGDRPRTPRARTHRRTDDRR